LDLQPINAFPVASYALPKLNGFPPEEVLGYKKIK